MRECTKCGKPITAEQIGAAWRAGDSAWYHGECPVSQFRADLAEHLAGRQTYGWMRVGNPGRMEVRPDEIADITVHWDAGSTYENEDYGETIRPASLEIEVNLTDGNRVQADPAWCLERLLKEALQ